MKYIYVLLFVLKPRLFMLRKAENKFANILKVVTRAPVVSGYYFSLHTQLWLGPFTGSQNGMRSGGMVEDFPVWLGKREKKYVCNVTATLPRVKWTILWQWKVHRTKPHEEGPETELGLYWWNTKPSRPQNRPLGVPAYSVSQDHL